MAQAQTFNQVINREHKLDLLTTVAPDETPILSGMPKSMAQQATQIEWFADNLETVNIAGTIEGTDQTTFEDKNRNIVRLTNRYQEQRRPYSVSNIEMKVATAGMSDPLAYAKAKCITELKIDLESAIGSDTDVQTGTGLVPSLLRGLGAWINASTTGIDSSVRTPSGSIGTTSTLTESTFNDVLQSVYESSGVVMDMRLYGGTILQRKISGFTRTEGTVTPTPFQVNSDQSSREIIFSVQFYRGDFANVQVISDQFLGRTTGAAASTASKQRGYLMSPEKFSVSVWEQPNIIELSDDGGGPRGFSRAMVTTICKNPKAFGKFAG